MHSQSDSHELLRELRPHVLFALLREGGPWLWAKLIGAGILVGGAAFAKSLFRSPYGPTLLGVLVVLSLGLILTGVILARRSHLKFTTLDAKLECFRDNPTINYKAKLRVCLENATAQTAVLREVKWEAHAPADVPFQPPFWYRLQIETSKGGWRSDQWRPEATEITVNSGLAFRASVGLDPAHSDDDLRRRLVLEQLGTMVIRAEVGGSKKTWRLRL
jgi:hypothetical protein